MQRGLEAPPHTRGWTLGMRTPPEEEEAVREAARHGQHHRQRERESRLMVLYLDTSALLKRYVAEPESEDVIAKMDEATAITTALIAP